MVDDCFVEFVFKAPTGDYTFNDYILENDINKESRFPPNIRPETPTINARTTKRPEAFHEHFNVQFYTIHKSLLRVHASR